MEAKQTPLIDLLERIPQGARLVVEHDQFSSSSHPVGRLCHEAAAALRAALAEPVQEPVAWMDREGDLYKMPEIEGWAPPHTMLYAAPPQRKPLPERTLTDEVIADLWYKNGTYHHHFARAIERWLKGEQ